ncbi:MAG: hypothetical protein U0169_14325 [Polyangiaceae bacterium]
MLGALLVVLVHAAPVVANGAANGAATESAPPLRDTPTAWQGSRPPECGAGSGSPNVWERAKSPVVKGYCDRLARGAAKLAADASLGERVLALVDEAEAESPGHAATSVLRGRALESLGRHADAVRALTDARTKDPRSTDDAPALLAFARSLAAVGKAKEARDEYRALLPRASSLPASERAAACLEAGMLAMDAGPSGLDEAEAAFRQALRVGWTGIDTVATYALALVLDRAGRRDEIPALLETRKDVDPRRALADANAATALGPLVAREFEALVAVASRDRAASSRAWKAYAADGGARSPWAAHAKEHAEGKPR